MPSELGAGLRVGLFVTCLVDLIRPSVGFAAVKLLEDAGCKVVVPSQTCCGQPAYNSGDRADAKAIARADARVRDCDYVVAPSGSCSGMLAKHYPELFADEPDASREAVAFAGKCRELISFLVDTLGRDAGRGALRRRCDLPRFLLRACANSACAISRANCSRRVEGLKLVELEDSDICCGFGGTFAVKYGELSDAIVAKKSAKIAATGADTLLAGDLGCLMNMAGKMQREGRKVRVRHVAEVLAGMTDDPPIGEGASR